MLLLGRVTFLSGILGRMSRAKFDNFSEAQFKKIGKNVYIHYPHFGYSPNMEQWDEFSSNYKGTSGNLPANLRSRFNAKFGRGSFVKYMRRKNSEYSNNMSAAAGQRAKFKKKMSAENASKKRTETATVARKGARATKLAEFRRSNPVQNFINGGKTKPEKESRSKIAYILATALKTGDEVPLHILEGAEAIRLANPTAYSATTGSELENLGIRIGVKTKSGHEATYPDTSRKEWVRYDSARGNNTPANMANEVDVVDFKEGVYSKDRDTGINLFNLIY